MASCRAAVVFVCFAGALADRAEGVPARDLPVRRRSTVGRAAGEGGWGEPIGELESRFVDAGGWGAHVRVSERGGGMPVVLVHDHWRAGFPRALRTFRLSLADRIEAQLPRVRAPTLVVRGSRDPIVPERWAREGAALLPIGRYAEVPGGPHCVNYTSPDGFVRLVHAFVGECG